jgi:5-methylcytosine-specific restriction endonuclease McrA
MAGHPQSAETRAKISASLIGNKRAKGWPKGKRHSEETKEKIRQSLRGRKNPVLSEIARLQVGEAHPRWAGDHPVRPVDTGHKRAEAMYPLRPCEVCGATPDEKEIHRHHRDLNPMNNEPWNIEFLCCSCHKMWHWALKKGGVICHL